MVRSALLAVAGLGLVQAGSKTPLEDCTNQWCEAAAANNRGPGRGNRSIIALRPVYDDLVSPCDEPCMRDMIWGPSGAATAIERASMGTTFFPAGYEGSTALDVSMAGESAGLTGNCDSYTWR